MKISELIMHLSTIMTSLGDLPVVYPNFITDGCGAGEVASLVVRRAKSPKSGSHIHQYSRGAYARNRYVRKDEEVVELRDYSYPMKKTEGKE